MVSLPLPTATQGLTSRELRDVWCMVEAVTDRYGLSSKDAAHRVYMALVNKLRPLHHHLADIRELTAECLNHEKDLATRLAELDAKYKEATGIDLSQGDDDTEIEVLEKELDPVTQSHLTHAPTDFIL